jgi:plasmid stabilization system protein ParE
MSGLSIHPLVQRDLRQILNHYTEEGGSRLADRFFNEVEVMVAQISKNPERFHFIDDRYRRANFSTFPYHFIFESNLAGPRITILRHHRRNPRYGRNRR